MARGVDVAYRGHTGRYLPLPHHNLLNNEGTGHTEHGTHGARARMTGRNELVALTARTSRTWDSARRLGRTVEIATFYFANGGNPFGALLVEPDELTPLDRELHCHLVAAGQTGAIRFGTGGSQDPLACSRASTSKLCSVSPR